MSRSEKRLLLLVASVPVLLVAMTLTYWLGMAHVENDPRTLLQSFEWATETLTTTGYGAETNWEHPLMAAFVAVAQWAGVFLVFLVFPIYLIPFLEERFESRLPRTIAPLSDHVVFYGYGPSVASTVDELAASAVETVVVEHDEERARRLVEHGHRVLFGEILDGVLERAYLLRARALLANGGDDENAELITTARQMGFDGKILALAENPLHRRPLMLTGADVVFTPRHALGAALAAQASRRISPAVTGLHVLGGQLRVEEFRVTPSSDLAGKSLEESGIGRTTGTVVLAQWVGGEMRVDTAGMMIEPGAILVVAGSESSLAKLEELCEGTVPVTREGAYVILGAGQVGSKVAQLLRDAGEDCLLIDRQAMEGVDLVGDALDQRILEKADICGARAVIVALDSDAAVLFATAIVKDMSPEVPVLVRVSETDNLDKLHQVGADSALALSQVASQILTSHLLGEERIAVGETLRLLRTEAPRLAGQPLRNTSVRERTGCSIVAVERNGHLRVDVGPDFEPHADDVLYICGTAQATHRFGELYAPRDS